MSSSLTPPEKSLNSYSISIDNDEKSENDNGAVVMGTNIAMCADKTVLLTPMGDVLVSMAYIMMPNLSGQVLVDSATAEEIMAYGQFFGLDTSGITFQGGRESIGDRYRFRGDRPSILRDGGTQKFAYSVLACTTPGTAGDPTGSFSAIPNNAMYTSPSRSRSTDALDNSWVDSCCESIGASAAMTGLTQGIGPSNAKKSSLTESNKIRNKSSPHTPPQSSSDWTRVASEFVASLISQKSFQSSSSQSASLAPTQKKAPELIKAIDSQSTILTGRTHPCQGGGGLLGGQEDPSDNDAFGSIGQENNPITWGEFPQPDPFPVPASHFNNSTPPQTPNRLIRSLLTSVSFEETKEDLYCETSDSDATNDLRNPARVLEENVKADESGHPEIGLSSFDVVDSTLMETVPSFDYSHLENDMSQMYSIECQLAPSVKKSIPVSDSGKKGIHSSVESQVITSTAIHNDPKMQAEVFEDGSHHPKKESPVSNDESSIPYVTEGIPMFLPSLAQVKVTKISAHPLGAHVLFISDSALLFSYGSNKYGQLGLGHRKDTEHPEVVISFLEGGGKALDCAAGAAHSLVVVKTSSERTQRLWNARKVSVRLSESETDDESITPRGSSEADLSFENKTGNLNDDCATRSAFSAVEAMRPSWSNHIKSRSPKSVLTSEMAHNSDSNQCGPISIHQVYGFGQNTYYKLGLLQQPSDTTEDILLPRRVGLNCKIWQDDSNVTSSSVYKNGKDPIVFGIFNIAASLHHSAALVRRANGATECYTWGYAGDGALGHCFKDSRNDNNSFKRKSVRTPAMVERLSQRGGSSRFNSRTEKTRINPTYEQNPENYIGSDIPKSIAVGNRCTILLTAQGRCMAFGRSESGVLGLGNKITEAFEPTFLKFKHPYKSESTPILTSVNIGSTHAVAISSEGYVFTWGSNEYGKLGFSPDENATNDRLVWSPRYLPFDHSESHCRPHSYFFPRKIPKEFSECDNPRQIRSRSASPSRGTLAHQSSRKFFESEQVNSPTRSDLYDSSLANDSKQTVCVCAGLDATVFVMRSGEVLSCGRSSGRLGQGEVLSDVFEPTPLYGGLHLWHFH